MYLHRIPNSTKVLVSMVIFLGGVGLLGKAYLEVSNSERAYIFFWSGLFLCFASVIAIGGNRESKPIQRVFGLILLGAALYIPIYLRSPHFPIFQDALFHVQSLELMRDLKTSQIPITFFPIAGDYPGLEYVGLATLYTSQLSINPVVQLLSLALHIIMPILAFYTYRTLGLEDATAFWASLIYIANIGYFFFLSSFSYGTFGVVLFLFIALLGFKKNLQEKDGAINSASLLLLAIPSIVIVHHTSSAMAAIYLTLLGITSIILKRQYSIFGVAIYSIVLWFVWLFYHPQSFSYLYGNMVPRAASILEFILKEQTQTHQLFLNSPLPPIERIIAYMYPILLLLLCGLSLWNVLDRKRHLIIHSKLFTEYITLAIFGPVSWFMIGPLIISDNAEIVYRISPYFFLGVGFYSALFICEWSQKNGFLRRLVLFSVVFLILAGGIIIGDNQAGRFRSNEVQRAAGPEVLTTDLIHAADWLEMKYGRLNLTVGDLMSSVAFSVFGMQRTDVYPNWTPFYTPELSTAQAFMDEQKIDYLVVDLRDSQFPPRYRYYFNQTEIYDESLQNRFSDKTFPLSLLMKFDKMPDLQRIYDNGDIVIYANKPLNRLMFSESPLFLLP